MSTKTCRGHGWRDSTQDSRVPPARSCFSVIDKLIQREIRPGRVRGSGLIYSLLSIDEGTTDGAVIRLGLGEARYQPPISVTVQEAISLDKQYRDKQPCHLDRGRTAAAATSTRTRKANTRGALPHHIVAILSSTTPERNHRTVSAWQDGGAATMLERVVISHPEHYRSGIAKSSRCVALLRPNYTRSTHAKHALLTI